MTMWFRTLPPLLLLLLSVAVASDTNTEECVLGEDGSCLPEEETCQDSDDRCSFWASEHDECEKNPKYMLASCRKSCKTCGMKQSALDKMINRLQQKTEEEKLKDVNLEETPWGVTQEVAPNTVDAEATAAVIEKTKVYMEQTVLIDSKFDKVRDECKNRNPQCAFWAVSGECEANPNYMTLQCAPSCQTCHLIDFDARCPLDLSQPVALKKPGDLDELFANLTTKFNDKYQMDILSMPQPESSSDIPSGPWVVTLENFLTDEECDRLIQLGAGEGYEISRDVGKKKFDGSYDGLANDRRTSTNAWCKDECFEDAVTQNVLRKIEEVTGVPDSNSEFLQLLRYEPGQFYRTHHDYIPHHTERQEGVRILTVFLYLNDVEAGGGTDFPLLDLTVMPKRGKALIWPSVKSTHPNTKDPRTDHQALPVEKGIKYGANAWIHQRDFKDTFKRGCH